MLKQPWYLALLWIPFLLLLLIYWIFFPSFDLNIINWLKSTEITSFEVLSGRPLIIISQIVPKIGLLNFCYYWKRMNLKNGWTKEYANCFIHCFIIVSIFCFVHLQFNKTEFLCCCYCCCCCCVFLNFTKQKRNWNQK